MCQYVLSSLCCWLRQCWRRCVGCCVLVTVQKKKEVIRPSFFFSESSYDNSSGGFGCSRTFFQLSVSSHHVSLSSLISLLSSHFYSFCLCVCIRLMLCCCCVFGVRCVWCGTQKKCEFSYTSSVITSLEFVFLNFRLTFGENLLFLSVQQSPNLCVSNV